LGYACGLRREFILTKAEEILVSVGIIERIRWEISWWMGYLTAFPLSDEKKKTCTLAGSKVGEKFWVL
jgi:hypothetical protein